jgi:heme exporter protein A
MLYAKSLSCLRDRKLLFYDLSFEIKPGSTLLVTGGNGVGKSTLLRMIAGFIPIKNGSIHYNGLEITNSLEDIAKDIGYFGHLGAIKEQLSIEENIKFWNYLFNKGYKIEIDPFNLNNIKHKIVSSCSTGQKRKLSLSRLLSTQKKIWLLDEPTTSLDQDSITSLIIQIKAHCALGGITIITSHQPLELPNMKHLEILKPKTPALELTSLNDPFIAGEW